MHQQVLCVGKRGSGKTVSVVNLVKKLDYDRVFIISPTFKSNAANMQLLAIDEGDVYEDTDDISVIDTIKEEIESEAKDYDEYHKRKELYKKFLKHKNSGNNIPDDLLLEFFDPVLQQFVAPFHWLNGKRHGQGNEHHANGYHYLGQWANNKYIFEQDELTKDDLMVFKTVIIPNYFWSV